VLRLARLYSRAGEHGILWHALAVAGLLLDGERRSTYLRMTRAVAVGYVLNTAIKYVVRRPRPAGGRVATISRYSYPSAHATMSFAAAAVLPPLLPAATAMALTRPYLGVHHPSDIAAGAALGVAVAELTP
jgi:membrane-associated phospholipid phosphatase